MTRHGGKPRIGDASVAIATCPVRRAARRGPIVDRPEHLFDRQEAIVDRPQHLFDRDESIVDRREEKASRLTWKDAPFKLGAPFRSMNDAVPP